VYKDGEFVAYIFDPVHDAGCEPESGIEKANLKDLVTSAKRDIDANDQNMF
jgi:hypothetical protein